MPTQREYERKFLLRNVPKDIKTEMQKEVMITQYYADDGTRYRAQRLIGDDNKKWPRFTKTTKVPTENPEVRIEDESRIDEREYNEAVAGLGTRVAKRRYSIDKGYYEIVVDVFLDFALVMAELEIITELDDVDASTLDHIQLPPFIQKELLLEVTHMDQFKNSNLAKM